MENFAHAWVQQTKFKGVVGYIDPGTGQVFQSTFSLLLSYLLPFLASIFFFFRKKFSFIFKRPIILIGLCTLIFVCLFLIFKKRFFPMKITHNKVIILGFDGMDPKIVDTLISEGKLPTFQRLKEAGYYSELETTIPPQSPVAWASFATGKNPSEHGIFDFISRNPATYGIDLNFAKKEKQFKTDPFWKSLSENGITSTILFLPNTYPASPLKGKMISGMGTPDVVGTQGRFTLFSSKKFTLNDKWRGLFIPIANTTINQTSIKGMAFEWLGEKKVAEIPLQIQVDEKSAHLLVQNKKIDIAVGTFSDWVQLDFAIDFFTHIHATGKFYLKSVSPDIELYLSPLVIDPSNPYSSISWPKEYSKELVHEVGMFSTLGLPLDTWALEEGIFDKETFLKQAYSVESERENIYYSELKNNTSDVLFGYFGLTDIVQHMFWNDMNNDSSPYTNEIYKAYERMDEILKNTLLYADNKTPVIVLSDHGFGGFDYEFNLNTWLKNNGYLSLENNVPQGGPLLDKVDWNKTTAYAVGYNSLFINLEGREQKGIVQQKKYSNVVDEIRKKLLGLKNPSDDASVIKNVYTRTELGIDENDVVAPDLIVGYYRGVRGSWSTAVGETPLHEFEKRETQWSGDHLFDKTEVPGIFFSNKKDSKIKKITDIIPWLMHFYSQ